MVDKFLNRSITKLEQFSTKGVVWTPVFRKNSAQMDCLADMSDYPSGLIWMGSSKSLTDYLSEVLDCQEPIFVDLNL